MYLPFKVNHCFLMGNDELLFPGIVDTSDSLNKMFVKCAWEEVLSMY